ncbi:MAG TPA: cation-transporting P-type ATPase [Oligoflexus sp.]|uniref:cation-translocating P-type ATPase n=1 Tax=Oligoflexus sp. TaxID=1971216 RepID=UPI002D7E8C95|nr:cation-transporting P-type ATPase [Oligoflexus sp.]HET9236637.1 cation-transporting P-type ATPase [Oligoflexus sp.]
MKTVSFASLSDLEKREGGLSAADVSRQRARFGRNRIVEVAGHPWLDLLIETIKDPMIWFLVGIGSAFLLTGAISDGITLFVAVLPLLFMDALLHWRTQASIAGLKTQLMSHVTVIREALQLSIDSQDLVPGDIVCVSPGMNLPADGIFETAKDIQVDESVLTGEAFPMIKTPTQLDPFELSKSGEVPVPSENLAFAGTRVLTGNGLLRVMATGQRTAYGEIVQSISSMPNERTPLQKAIAKLVQVLIYSAALLCLILAALRLYQGHGWLDALLSAATLAVAAIPEEFPVVFTFFLGVGIYRLAQRKALVRRAVSVENIGRVTQICSDKTGTITAGRLELTHWETAAAISKETLLETAAMASSSANDPLDLAIHKAVSQRSEAQTERIRCFPFTEDRKRETVWIKTPEGTALACSKGAPETLLGRSRLSIAERLEWLDRVSQWAQSGHKVVACARKEMPFSGELLEPEEDMEFCGLLAFEDPPRPGVAESIAYCHLSGIRVLMITGDHPETSRAIARDAGLAREPIVISAEGESEKFTEAYLARHPDFLKEIHVVARCTPIQKLRIVKALKASGELVAVTGDGVNDAPALKSADIGIAMGERGTRSAKEVSSIILGDDNFTTIVNAIREGRQLFKNLQMSFGYLFLIHIPLVTTAAVVPLANFPLVYMPVHIVWLELVIHPTALLAFQAKVHPDDEQRVERAFFPLSEVLRISISGLFVSAALATSFIAGVNEGYADSHARAKAMALLTFWSAAVVLYLTRSQAAKAVAAVTVVSSVLLIQNSDRLTVLKLAPLHPMDWMEIVLLVVIMIGLTDVMKRFLTSRPLEWAVTCIIERRGRP